MAKNNFISKNFTIILLLLCIGSFRIISVSRTTIIPYPSEINVIQSVLSMTESKSLDTGFYNHPDNVLLYSILLVDNLYSLITTHSPISSNLDLRNSDLATPAYLNSTWMQYLYIARIVNVFFSLITIFLCYLIGNQFPHKFGIIAALFVGLFPSYNAWSCLLLSDTCLTTLLCFSIYFSIRYLLTGKKLYLFFTTFFCALSTFQKYPGIMSTLIVVYIIFISSFQTIGTRFEKIKKFLFTGIIQFITYIISCIVFSPWLLTHIRDVINIFSKESRSVHLGADQLGYWGNMWFYLKVFMNQAGIITLILCILGTLLVIVNHEFKQFAPIFIGFIMLLFMSKLGLHWERWSLPFHISFLMLLAYLFSNINSFIITNFKANTKFVTASHMVEITLFVFICINMATNSYVDFLERSKSDTRVAYTDILRSQGITEENTYFETYTPFSPSCFYTSELSLEECDYYMISSYNYDRYLLYSDIYPQQASLYQILESDAELVYEIIPWNNSHSMMDNSVYTPFALKSGILQLFSNFSTIINYYTIPTEQKLFGPTIKVYRINS